MKPLKIANSWFAIGMIALCTVLVAGCKNQEPDPYVVPGNTPDPNWEVTVENDLTSSLTAIVKVSFAKSEGTLAAFMGNECCGIAEYIEGLYWLYVSPATEAGSAVQLRFYSPELKRVFEAKETFPYSNDNQLGTIAAPYVPEWMEKK